MPIVALGDYKFSFEPKISLTSLPDHPAWTPVDYANEPMLFSANPAFAWQNGGPMTRQALSVLLEHGDMVWRQQEAPDLNWVIDTRVHMLMPGMFPAIGGWHCDAVPRPGGLYGDQPNPELYDERVTHCVVTFSPGETSRTEFLLEPITAELRPGSRVWSTVHEQVVAQPRLTQKIEHNSFISFDQGTLHRATAASAPGWRFFFRASLYSSKPQNQIRRQVQVYMPEGLGW